MGKSVFSCFRILKPTVNESAQYPAQIGLRYSPVQCTSETDSSNRRRKRIDFKIEINTELLMFALISRLTHRRSKNLLQVRTRLVVTQV